MAWKMALLEIDMKNDLQEVYTYVRHSKEKNDGKSMDAFSKTLEFVGNLDQKQQERLREITAKCPVYKTLQQASNIQTSIKNGN